MFVILKGPLEDRGVFVEKCASLGESVETLTCFGGSHFKVSEEAC